MLQQPRYPEFNASANPPGLYNPAYNAMADPLQVYARQMPVSSAPGMTSRLSFGSVSSTVSQEDAELYAPGSSDGGHSRSSSAASEEIAYNKGNRTTFDWTSNTFDC